MPLPTLVAGSLLGSRFRIVRLLGTGGYGSVYQAERLADGQPVALKVLHTAVASDEIERRRFRREAQVMAELRHPHVAQVVETGTTADDAPYLALELLRGRSLRDELKRAGPRSVAWVGEVGRQVLQALAAAHERGTVHRDLKPHNLFLCGGPDDPPFVKVLDFGIAKLAGAGKNAHTKLTATGVILGTPQYMAPEQVYGDEVGPAADLYALGLIMAEALAGRRIVEGADSLAVLMAQAGEAPVSLPPEVTSSPLGGVIGRAVQKPLAHRYPSAGAMLVDLERALPTPIDHPPPLPPPPPPAAHQALTPWLVGGLAFLLIVLGGGAGFGWWWWNRDRGSSSELEGGKRPGSSSPRWSGRLEELPPKTMKAIVAAQGWQVGELDSRQLGSAEGGVLVHSVHTKRGAKECGVSLTLYPSAASAAAGANAMSAPYPLAVEQEQRAVFVVGCSVGDPQPLFHAVMAARR